ncbi:MAG: hypothetical protein RL026_1189 [Pseudomonadota bacterium]
MHNTPVAAGAVDRDWWRGAVIYQVYPRSFADSNGDGTGDLPGILARLDHIASLGVDAIWISPFFKSPMKDFGYDISDYRQVDPVFGTLADFDRLVAGAHARGIKVIIDQVLSHTSDEHEWFKASRASREGDKADWYVWADPQPDGSPPNNWLSIFGGAGWQWEPRRQQYYLHNFLVSQPDLNFHNPQVVEAVLDAMEFWLRRGVDGFRLDAINFCFHDPLLRNNPAKPAALRKGRGYSVENPYAYQYHLYDNTQPENLRFLERVRALLERYPGATSLGEVSCEDPMAAMADYTAGGRRLHMVYNFELLVDQFSTRHVREVIEALEARGGDTWPCWAVGNHDVARVVSRWALPGAAADRARLFNAFLLSLKGSVCSFQGEELGLEEADIPFEKLRDPYGIAFWPSFKGRDGCRTPMPWSAGAAHAGFTTADEAWLPVPAAHQRQAVDLQQQEPTSVLQAYQRFIAWRRDMPALRRGSLCFIDSPEGSLAFLREHSGQCLLAAFNFTGEDQRILLPADWGVAAVVLQGHGFAPVAVQDGGFMLAPLQAAWLQRAPVA